jgi:hypothetical protein
LGEGIDHLADAHVLKGFAAFFIHAEVTN